MPAKFSFFVATETAAHFGAHELEQVLLTIRDPFAEACSFLVMSPKPLKFEIVTREAAFAVDGQQGQIVFGYPRVDASSIDGGVSWMREGNLFIFQLFVPLESTTLRTPQHKVKELLSCAIWPTALGVAGEELELPREGSLKALIERMRNSRSIEYVGTKSLEVRDFDLMPLLLEEDGIRVRRWANER